MKSEKHLSEVLTRKILSANQIIFRQGDSGACAYVIQKGKVEISSVNEKGETGVLGVIGDNGIFGEMALIDEQPRMATAKALTTTTVYVVNKEAFNQKLKNADPFLKALLQIFVKNIRELSKKIENK
ncbi:MAG: Crp/Fnr family transcriptional regulator [Alphaproteobacteria bacterium]|nr:Crp/Fnr family transcriptional regulator [Alphaproteobacteria bacterium]